MPGLKAEDHKFSRVADFYNGKSLFVTGASGFVGAVLLEILFRCCPGIKSVYVLLRSKKNVQPDIRKEQIFNKKIFERLKEKTPDLLKKVHVIAGDAALPNLGMSDSDMQLLIEEVSVVFHCAAIINFSKPLKFILLQNVLGLNCIIGLCRKMKKFEAMVYTSTAYSNCNHKKYMLREDVYRLPFRAEEFLDALKNDHDERLQEMFSFCKPEWPNTYTFSKCLAENLIMDTASDLPIAIIRPSIIYSSWKHPIPGYLETNSGIAAITVGAGNGVIQVMNGNPEAKMNLVPVDIVANAHVLAAWSIGTKRCAPPMVVHCTASEKFHIKVSEFSQITSSVMKQYPLPQSFAKHTRFHLVHNKYMYYILAAYYHYLPALVLDVLRKLLWKRPRMISLYRFFDTVSDSLNFFVFNTFEFEQKNFKYLDELLHPEDREDLSLDVGNTTFPENALKIPEASPFYDWKKDKKSQSARLKIALRRRILIDGIQGVSIVLFCLFISWMFYLIF